MKKIPDKKLKHTKLTKYQGNLQEYFETGMECLGFIFHDDRGNHEDVDWENREKTRMYKDISWSLWFDKYCTHYIKIFNRKGKVVYEGPLSTDSKKIEESKYVFSFLPKEIPTEKWEMYCKKQYRAELYTNEVPHAIKEQFGDMIPFKVGDKVKDDLTNGTKAFILNMTYELKEDGSPKSVGYLINSDYLDGARYPWELSHYTYEDIMEEMENKEYIKI